MGSAAETLLLHGFQAWTGWKKPVDLCSTTDHPQSYLVGEQFIDGVLASHGMRVLLRGQIPARENGIFVVNSLGPWTRAKDFDSETSMLPGSTIVVCQGTNNSGVYRMTTPVSGTVTPGSTNIAFSKVGEFSTSILTALGIEFPGDAEIAAGGGANELTLTASTTHVAGPLTVQGYSHDPKAVLSWHQPVRAATTADIWPMAGLLTVDGVSVVVNDRVLVKNNTVASQNGIYIVQNAGWTRAVDFNDDLDVVRGCRIAVTEGTANAGKTFYLSSAGPYTIGVTNFTFTEVPGGGGSYTAGDGLTLTGSDIDIDLTDTTIFTNSGAASRAVVTDGAGNIYASSSAYISTNVYCQTVTRNTAGAMGVGTTNQTGLTVGRVGATTTIDSSALSLRSAGNIALRPTGASIDEVVVAIDTGELKITTPKTTRWVATGNAIFEGSSAAYLNVNTVSKFHATTTTTTLANSNITENCAAGALTQNAGAITKLLSTANAREQLAWINSGYQATTERRYFYGVLTAASATALTGSFTPAIANGTVRVMTNVIATRTVGGTGGFGITTTATFTVVSGVVTQVATYTELAPAEETAAGTGVYHDNSASQIRLVAIGIASETWRFEGYTDVFYAAA